MSDDMNNLSASEGEPSRRGCTKKFRFAGGIWGVLAIWEAFGVFFSIGAFFAANPQDFWPMQSVATLICHLPVALGALWVARLRLDAEESGLRVRGFARTRFIPWQDIEDFGFQLSPSNQQNAAPLAVVVTPARTWKFSRMWKPFDELLELIARHATRAKTREWGTIGTRECDDGRQTFRHRDTPNWQIAAYFCGFSALMALRVTGGTSPQTIIANMTPMWNSLSVAGRFAFVSSMSFGVFALPGVLIAAHFMGLRQKRRMLEVEIVATRDGLELWNGPSRRVCSWREVERFELEPVRGSLQLPLCVVWARGQKFEWHSGIEQGRLLREIVRVRSLNASTKSWKYPPGRSEDNLGDELSQWPSGVVGIGPKRYGYHTRTNRALLAGGLVMLTAFGFGSATSLYQRGYAWADVPSALVACALFSPVFLLVIGGLVAWNRAWVETTDEELRHHSLFGPRALRWDSVRRVSFDGYHLAIKGEGRTIRLGLVADFDHLVEEIETKSGVKMKRTDRKSGS